MSYRFALQAPADDQLVRRMVQQLRKAHQMQLYLEQNLADQTKTEATWLQQAVEETAAAYQQDWDWYGVALQDLSDIGNRLSELDNKADATIDYLEDLYAQFAEHEYQADQQGYPDNHPIYRLVDLLDELLDMELD